MVDHYETLGVQRSATAREIKRAFQKRAFELHPDSSTHAGDKHKFQQVLEAYTVLRNAASRREYDAMLDTKTGSGGFWWEAGHDEDKVRGTGFKPSKFWDPKYDEWVRRASRGFEQYAAEAEYMRKEREKAQRKSHYEAFEQEKLDAKENKKRFERIMYKTKHAYDVRKLNRLKMFWQSSSGIVWQDVAIGTVLLGTVVGGLVELGSIFMK